jgi:hypothetical protein
MYYENTQCIRLWSAVVAQTYEDLLSLEKNFETDLEEFNVVDEHIKEDLLKLQGEITNEWFNTVCDNANINYEMVKDFLYKKMSKLLEMRFEEFCKVVYEFDIGTEKPQKISYRIPRSFIQNSKYMLDLKNQALVKSLTWEIPSKFEIIKVY